MGENLSEDMRKMCILRSPVHPIVLYVDGDALVHQIGFHLYWNHQRREKHGKKLLPHLEQDWPTKRRHGSEMKPKKIEEARALAAARTAGAPIPFDEIADEEPDFTFNNGLLGVEVSELMRPSSSNFGISPAEEEAFHQDLVGMAEARYYEASGAKPVYVSIHFENARGLRRNKQQVTKLAQSIAEFVKKNVDRSKTAFYQPEIPQGLSSIVICTDLGQRTWWCGECGGYTVSEIRQQLATRINAKNKLVQKYRMNLAEGAAVWLLLFSDSTVARSMSVPFGLEEWEFNFDFDRVFWFTCLEREVVEIKRADI
jgi:hypothetical protein